MSDHKHVCCACGWEYNCEFLEPDNRGKTHYTKKECKKSGVFKAVEVNKDGPYCHVCRTGIEFLRFCALRPGLNPFNRLCQLHEVETKK